MDTGNAMKYTRRPRDGCQACSLRYRSYLPPFKPAKNSEEASYEVEKSFHCQVLSFIICQLVKDQAGWLKLAICLGLGTVY